MKPRINEVLDSHNKRNVRLVGMTQLERLNQHYDVLSYWVLENYELLKVATKAEDIDALKKHIAFIEKLQAETLQEMKALGYEVIR